MKYNCEFFSLLGLTLSVLGFTSQQCYADENLTTDFTANILDGTCQISLANGGEVRLPVVSKEYFNDDNGTPNKYSPNDYVNGKSFSILLSSCPTSEGGSVNKIHFSFKSQSDVYPASSKQIFANEIQPEAGGASNVGFVIFSDATKTNVLKEDGTSDVIYDVEGKSYQTTYLFDVRYQNYGDITSGSIVSHVEVSAVYE